MNQIRIFNEKIKEAVDGGVLNGCYFSDNPIREHKTFPTVSTKMVKLKTLSLSGGRITTVGAEIILSAMDILSNNDDDTLDLQDSLVDKISIMLGLTGARTDDDISFIDVTFQGNRKGMVAAIMIEIN